MKKYIPRYLADQNKEPSFALTFEGFLAVRLMEFDYAGKHYSYHGRKLENAVKRLMRFAKGENVVPSTAELVTWGQASHDWKLLAPESITP